MLEGKNLRNLVAEERDGGSKNPIGELPRAKALRLPASTTDSIPLTGYGGLISTGLKSLRPVGTHIIYHQHTI